MIYFSDNKNWERVQPVVNNWLGTPYRHLWMKQGRGADCSLFIGALLMELGIVSSVPHDFYSADWYLYNQVEVIKDNFANHVRGQLLPGFTIEILPFETPLRGDMVGFATIPSNRVTNHTALMMDPPDHFVHSIRKRGVSFMQMGNFWRDRITTIYRVHHGI